MKNIPQLSQKEYHYWNHKTGICMQLLLIICMHIPTWGAAEQTKAPMNDIHASIEAGNLEAVEYFLQQGNDVNRVYAKGYTLLFYAIKHDKTDLVALSLLKHGADPNSDTGGRTPLMYATKYKKYCVMKALLAFGAKVNYVSQAQGSALSYAIKGADVKALQLLLDHGGDVRQKVMGDKTVVDMAQAANNKAVLAVLGLPHVPSSDGPHVFEGGEQRQAIWLCDGKQHRQPVSMVVPQMIQHCDLSANLWSAGPAEVDELSYQGDFKVAAFSDIHGQLDLFIRLLKQHHIIDELGRWHFGDGHLVITGDVFDRGPHVTEVLWFLYDLEQQAKKQGGRVHMLLGNHEVMVLNGDLRYLDPKYLDVADALNMPYDELFVKNSVLGAWLRSRPVLVKINGMLFLHGGIHPELLRRKMSLEDINTVFKTQLVADELELGRNELGTLLHKSDGPIWYRGYFKEPTLSEAAIKQQLQYFDVQHIVVGHTSFKTIKSLYGGLVIGIDAYMKGGESGEVLLWEQGEFKRGLLNGEQLPLH